MALAWTKFFWSDYAADPALKICSLAAQGLWMRLLCIAAEHEPIGYVAINGEGLDAEGIAVLVGAPLEQINELLIELKRRGVYSVDRRGWIYSRRMINDAKKSRKASERGKLGGNPTLRKDTDNSALLKLEDKRELKAGDKPQKPEARVQKEKEPSVPKTKTTIPADFTPAHHGDGTKSAAIVAKWGVEEYQLQLERFAAHHRKEGSKFVDWQAAWSTWVLNSERFKGERHDRTAAASGGGYLEHFLENELPRYSGEKG